MEVDSSSNSSGSGQMSMAKLPSNTLTTSTTVKQMASVQPPQLLAGSDSHTTSPDAMVEAPPTVTAEADEEQNEDSFDILSVALSASLTTEPEQLHQQQNQSFVLTTLPLMEVGPGAAVIEPIATPQPPPPPSLQLSNPLAASVNEIAQISALTAAISPIQTIPTFPAPSVGLAKPITMSIPGEDVSSSVSLLVIDESKTFPSSLSKKLSSSTKNSPPQNREMEAFSVENHPIQPMINDGLDSMTTEACVSVGPPEIIPETGISGEAVKELSGDNLPSTSDLSQAEPEGIPLSLEKLSSLAGDSHSRIISSDRESEDSSIKNLPISLINETPIEPVIGDTSNEITTEGSISEGSPDVIPDIEINGGEVEGSSKDNLPLPSKLSQPVLEGIPSSINEVPKKSEISQSVNSDSCVPRVLPDIKKLKNTSTNDEEADDDSSLLQESELREVPHQCPSISPVHTTAEGTYVSSAPGVVAAIEHVAKHPILSEMDVDSCDTDSSNSSVVAIKDPKDASSTVVNDPIGIVETHPTSHQESPEIPQQSSPALALLEEDSDFVATQPVRASPSCETNLPTFSAPVSSEIDNAQFGRCYSATPRVVPTSGGPNTNVELDASTEPDLDHPEGPASRSMTMNTSKDDPNEIIEESSLEGSPIDGAKLVDYDNTESSETDESSQCEIPIPSETAGADFLAGDSCDSFFQGEENEESDHYSPRGSTA